LDRRGVHDGTGFDAVGLPVVRAERGQPLGVEAGARGEDLLGHPRIERGDVRVYQIGVRERTVGVCIWTRRHLDLELAGLELGVDREAEHLEAGGVRP
jgi:hypothetical protein